jgi:hypothetical protein
MPPTTDDLGPLPEGDRQETLQQLSLIALRRRLPADRFLFRDERVDDKGVDGSLEVKVEANPSAAGGGLPISRFTNFRSQVQLKSTAKAARNQDGSVSVAIETSNLNYLLNGPCPIYFLWISATDEMRFAWAREEWKRLDAENPVWQKQGTFTIRFRETLDVQTVGTIHERILEEARLTRRIGDALSRSSLAECVVVSIDPKSLQSTDPRQLLEWVSESGMTIVSAGFAQAVGKWVDLLNPDDRQRGRVQLVASYASATLARYQEALGHLSAAALRRSELSQLDQQFLDYLRDSCSYQLGRMSLEEYRRREEAWADNQPGPLHRLEVLRHQRLATPFGEARTKLLNEMRERDQAFQNEPGASASQKLQARVILLGAEGDELSDRFLQRQLQVQLNWEIGYSVSEMVRTANAELAQEWGEWERRAHQAVVDAAAEKHPLLFAEAILTTATIHVGTMLFSRIQALGLNMRWTADEAQTGRLMEEARIALDIFHQAGSLEGETRANLLLADLCELLGKGDDERALAQGALVIAEAMGYNLLIERARAHLGNHTVYRNAERAIQAQRALDPDVRLASEADDAIRDVARYTVQSVGLPADRLAVVERDWFVQRRMARERLSHCRNLLLLDTTANDRSRATLFRTDPVRACVCDLHKFRSARPRVELDSLLDDFKRDHCSQCPDRAPKQ